METQLLVSIPKDLKRKLKLEAVKKDIRIKDIVIIALERYLSDSKKLPENLLDL